MRRLVCLVALLAACRTSPKGARRPDDATPGPGDGTADAAGSGSGTGAYLLYERFDAMPTGSAPGGIWQTQGSVVVREVPFAADKSAELAKDATSSTTSLGTTFAPQSGRLVVEAKVLARETAGFEAIPYLYDASGAAVASVAVQDGNLVAHVGAVTQTVMAIAANTWYRVRVVVDTEAGTFDLYVDGVRKLAGAALRTPSSAVTRLAYYVDGTTAETLVVDNIKVYNEASFIGGPPQPVFDPRSYGAAGDGATNDTAAIQRAIDAAAGTGGSVVLSHGTFLSGTLALHSHMTFFIAAPATLRGSTAVADYPAQAPATGNTQLSNCQRALLYADAVSDVTIDGGGTIDGQGDAFTGAESTRPMLVWVVLSDHVAVQNLYLKKGAVWSLVSMESDHVRIANVNVQSDHITHDGIDLVDGSDLTVQDVAVRSGDDAMCLKSGVRRGLDTVTIADSMFSGDSGGSNGIKVGTATYGAFQHITIRDSYVKDVQYAAMAVESRQGSDIDGVTFQRIEMANVGSPFFVYLAQQSTTHPVGDVPKLGSISNVSFTDIAGRTASWPNSPHQGALITGHVFDGVTYPIRALSFINVALAFDGGRTSVPAAPPEAMPDQYPESNMFGDLPGYGFYLRHVAGVTFTSCTIGVAAPDARPELVTDDVVDQVGSP